MVLDLFALAEANNDALTAEVDARRRKLSAAHAARLDMFCQTVSELGCISMNMRPWKMRAFLERGRYLSVHEMATERAVVMGRTAEEELRDHQGVFYLRRVLFDRSFVDGERFLYGALNIGGSGVDYGVFCIVLASNATNAESTAYLPGNSLDRYVRPAVVLALDAVALCREVATVAQRHNVAVLKHGDDITVNEAAAWASMLCSGECFVEAIFVGDITPNRIGEYRLKQDEMLRLNDLAFDVLRGKLNLKDASELQDFEDCIKSMKDLGLVVREKEV